MNTFEKCELVRTSILNVASEVAVYEGWDADYCVRKIRGLAGKLERGSDVDSLSNINPCLLTRDQMVRLGFGYWEKGNPMMLIPLWLYPFLTKEFNYESVNGEKGSIKSRMDMDHRFYCLAYGVLPLNTTKGSKNEH